MQVRLTASKGQRDRPWRQEITVRISKLMVAVLAWGSLGVASASADKIINDKEEPLKRPVATEKSTATSSDPAEPPLQVEVKYTGAFTGSRVGAPPGQKIAVGSGARGTMLTVPSHHGTDGTVELTFKNSAAPMRFTTRLTGMPPYDLSTLSLTSGSLTLQVGSLGTAATTAYFDSKGRVQEGAAGAAYTVTAKRGENGQVDVELRRAAGAKLGKSVSISWQSNLDNIRWKMRALKGG
jgi:hypothetical protein